MAKALGYGAGVGTSPWRKTSHETRFSGGSAPTAASPLGGRIEGTALATPGDGVATPVGVAQGPEVPRAFVQRGPGPKPTYFHEVMP